MTFRPKRTWVAVVEHEDFLLLRHERDDGGRPGLGRERAVAVRLLGEARVGTGHAYELRRRGRRRRLRGGGRGRRRRAAWDLARDALGPRVGLVAAPQEAGLHPRVDVPRDAFRVRGAVLAAGRRRRAAEGFQDGVGVVEALYVHKQYLRDTPGNQVGGRGLLVYIRRPWCRCSWRAGGRGRTEGCRGATTTTTPPAR